MQLATHQVHVRPRKLANALTNAGEGAIAALIVAASLQVNTQIHAPAKMSTLKTQK
jgi:hypothetical protein